MKNCFLIFFIVILTGIMAVSCATVPRKGTERWYSEEEERISIAERAYSLIGVKDLRNLSSVYRNDCSGFVLGLFRERGYNVKFNNYGRYNNLSYIMFLNLKNRGLVYYRGLPKKADVVFFRGTVPGTGGKITHVGLTYDVLEDRTIVIIHYGSRGVSKLRMNLYHPHLHRDDMGRVLNDFIVKKENRSRYGLLSAEHFAGFGDLLEFVSRY